jgi:hypothetical protein
VLPTFFVVCPVLTVCFLKFIVYAKDEDRFFRDFAKGFAKLLELGVPFAAMKPWWKVW